MTVAARRPAAARRVSQALLSRVRETIVAEALLRPRARVVVGVSGGPDSVALLHLLARLAPTFPLTLIAVHVDHQLRDESAADAEFVQRLAQQLRVPVVLERADVRAAMRAHGWSLEDGARRLRYQCLLQVARRLSADAVAVGHTADDQAETVLMRLLRGAGTRGLSGIPIKRPLDEAVWVVRPLLTVWRADVLAHLRQAELPFLVDPSNDDPAILRNRIRHELLPHLAQRYNPQVKAALVQGAAQSRQDSGFLRAAAARQWKRIAKPLASGEMLLSLPRFLRQPKAVQWQLVQVLVESLRGEWSQFEFRHWREVERLCQDRPTGTVLDLPGGLRMVRGQDTIRCSIRPD
jgi:tRNA(Ile)-lysidine synthase